MNRKLSGLPFVSDLQSELLAQAGIADSDKLLSLCATPESRAQLAFDTGLPLVLIQEWALIVDLLRVKGIGPLTAELIAKSGVVEAATGLPSLHPQLFQEALVAANSRLGLLKRVPSASVLRDLQDESSELRPRLVVKREEFVPASQLQSQAEMELRPYVRLSVGVLLALFGLLGVAGVLLIQDEARKSIERFLVLSPAPGAVDALEAFYDGAVVMVVGYIVLSVLALGVVFLLNLGFTHLYRSVLLPLLYPSKPYLRFYAAVQPSPEELRRSGRRMMWTTAFVILVLFGLALVDLGDLLDGGIGQLKVGACLSIPAIIGFHFVPETLRLARRLREGGHHKHQDLIQRFLVDRLSVVIYFAFMLWFLGSGFIAGGLTGYRSVFVETLISPISIAIQSSDRATQAEQAATGDPNERLFMQRSRFREMQEMLVGIQFRDSEGNALEGRIGPSLTQLFVCWIVFAALLVFFFPLGVFLGGGRAVLLLASAGLSYASEVFFTRVASEAFPLPQGSIMAFALLLIVLLLTGFAAKGVSGGGPATIGICPHCQNIADDALPACGHCGGFLR